MSFFGRGFGRNNEPVFAVLISWLLVQVSRRTRRTFESEKGNVNKSQFNIDSTGALIGGKASFYLCMGNNRYNH